MCVCVCCVFGFLRYVCWVGAGLYLIFDPPHTSHYATEHYHGHTTVPPFQSDIVVALDG